MTTRLTSFILIFALSLFTIGCDSGGGMQEEEPQETAELTLTIKNTANKAQTKADVERGQSSIKDGDFINVFVRNANGTTQDSTIAVPVPTQGESREVGFTVPAGDNGRDYDVELLGYREPVDNNDEVIEDKDGTDVKSAVLAATTGDQGEVNVEPGQVETVDFTTGSNGSNSDFTQFNFTFGVDLAFASDDDNGSKVTIDLSGSDLDQFIETGGGIGVSPTDESIDPGDYRYGSIDEAFSKSGSTLDTDKIKLPPGKYDDGKANVLLQFKINSAFTDNNVYLYNNVDASQATDVNIGGDGGIIIEF